MFNRIRCQCHLGTRTIKYKAVSFENNNLPRITIPQQMIQKLDKMKARSAAEKYKKHKTPVYKGVKVVSCKRKEYNHFKGQTYSNFNPQHLASHGWKHYKSAGDYFTLQAIQGNPSVLLGESVLQFSELGVLPELIDGMITMGITKPTNVQAAGIQEFNEGKNVLCAAETGSGKTLAYLLPLLQKAHYYKTNVESTAMNSPLGLIVVPSSELADQIQAVSAQLCARVNLKSRSLCGGRGTGKMLAYRNQNISDIMIVTPGLLHRVLTENLYSMKQLQTLILDEADTLLDDSFNDITNQIFRQIESKQGGSSFVPGVGTQIGFVGATMPRDLQNIIGELLPLESLSKVTTPHLHKIMPHIPQKFMRVKISEKPENLLKLLKTKSKKHTPTIVFSNKNSTCNFIGHLLSDQNIDHIRLNGDLSQKERRGQFEKFQKGDCNILITTDIASRGLDTIRAQHIINYDFPDFMSDYIHRVGRVGRVASQGTGFVISFVCHKWEVDLLWKIEAAARRVTELHNVNANIKRKLVSRHETDMTIIDPTVRSIGEISEMDL